MKEKRAPALLRRATGPDVRSDQSAPWLGGRLQGVERGLAVFEFGAALGEGGELGGGEALEGIAEARAAGLGRGDGAGWGDASL